MLNLEQCTVSEPVKRMLDTMFVQKRVPQALIIEGDHTKTTELARVLASGLVCRSQDNKPCGTCSSCIKARAGSHPDIYLAEGGLTPRSFKVEAIRAIRSDAYIQSQEGGCKVYLLFRAESMSAEAQSIGRASGRHCIYTYLSYSKPLAANHSFTFSDNYFRR